MALMIDSVTPAAIPRGTPVVAGYVDGPYGPNDPYGSGWTAAAWQRFPGSLLVPITTKGAAGARVYDIEKGDGTPDQGAVWCKSEIAAGRRPTLYFSTSVEVSIVAALNGRGVPVSGVDFWGANWNGTANVPAGYVAHQYLANVPGVQGSAIDYNATNGVWPGTPAPQPPHPPLTVTGEEMIAGTPSGNGYWICTPQGAIYTYGDAQYLNALNYPVNLLTPGDTATGFDSHPASQGYWISTAAGHVYAFGAAGYFGAPA